MELFNFIVYLVTMMGIYALMALSLNLQVGFTGLINFGQVMFFAVGAYTSGLLTVKAGAETVRLIALNEEWLTGGAFGVMDIPQPFGPLVGSDYYPLAFLGLTVILILVAYVFIHFITDSPFGRNLRGIRDAEDLCLSLGKNTRRIKVQAMFLAGMIAGLGGGLFAHYITFISPENFRPIETFLIWAMVIIGGRGNHMGAIVGAIVIQTFNVSTRFISGQIDVSSEFMGAARMAIVGLLIVLFLLYRSEGLLPERKKIYD